MPKINMTEDSEISGRLWLVFEEEAIKLRMKDAPY